MRLIDADHLIGLVRDATILGDGFKQAFIAIVRGEPTIEPERKVGKWKHDSDGLVWCDTCGFGKERSDDRLYRYCPNCGYRMMEGCENNV